MSRQNVHATRHSFEGNLFAQRHAQRLYVITKGKPEVSISPGLGLVPDCGGRTDGQTELAYDS